MVDYVLLSMHKKQSGNSVDHEEEQPKLDLGSEAKINQDILPLAPRDTDKREMSPAKSTTSTTSYSYTPGFLGMVNKLNVDHCMWPSLDS